MTHGPDPPTEEDPAVEWFEDRDQMIIIAGWLRVDPADRDAYLAVVAGATTLARSAPGCLDFTQSPDPLDAGQINIFERWETDADLDAFRALPGDDEVPPILGADVHRFRISAVEPP
jgi:quinol monooxygenase YgiN